MFRRLLKLILFIFFTSFTHAGDIKLNIPEYYPQTWNNCAPASLSMLLSYYNIDMDQKYIESIVKTNKNDVHIGVAEIEYFVKTMGFYLESRQLISVKDIIEIIDMGYPVITPIWYKRDVKDQMGHYIVINGYSLERRTLYILDPLNPGTREVDFTDFNFSWNFFNKTCLILSNRTIDNIARGYTDSELLANRLADVEENPNSFSSWYNLGSLYNSTREYGKALESYLKALEVGYPERFFWYNSDIFKTLYQTENFKLIIDITNKTFRSCLSIEELWYWRSKAQYKLGLKEEALISIDYALNYRSTYMDALEFKTLMLK